jgi:hypothetical protein
MRFLGYKPARDALRFLLVLFQGWGRNSAISAAWLLPDFSLQKIIY